MKKIVRHHAQKVDSKHAHLSQLLDKSADQPPRRSFTYLLYGFIILLVLAAAAESKVWLTQCQRSAPVAIEVVDTTPTTPAETSFTDEESVSMRVYGHLQGVGESIRLASTGDIYLPIVSGPSQGVIANANIQDSGYGFANLHGYRSGIQMGQQQHQLAAGIDGIAQAVSQADYYGYYRVDQDTFITEVTDYRRVVEESIAYDIITVLDQLPRSQRSIEIDRYSAELRGHRDQMITYLDKIRDLKAIKQQEYNDLLAAQNQEAAKIKEKLSTNTSYSLNTSMDSYISDSVELAEIESWHAIYKRLEKNYNATLKTIVSRITTIEDRYEDLILEPETVRK